MQKNYKSRLHKSLSFLSFGANFFLSDTLHQVQLHLPPVKAATSTVLRKQNRFQLVSEPVLASFPLDPHLPTIAK